MIAWINSVIWEIVDVSGRDPRKAFIALFWIISILILLFLFGPTLHQYLSEIKLDNIKTAFEKLIPIAPAIAILLSALWASVFVLHSAGNSRQTARLQETLNIIVKTEYDNDYISGKKIWHRYRGKDDHHQEFSSLFAVYHLGETEAIDIIREDAQSILTYLNSFEIASLAVNRKILDEKFYMEYNGTNFIRTWNYSVAAIGALRTLHCNPRLFLQWEEIVKKWKEELNVPNIECSKDYSIPDLAEKAKKDSKIIISKKRKGDEKNKTEKKKNKKKNKKKS